MLLCLTVQTFTSILLEIISILYLSFKFWTKCAILEWISLTFPFLKHLQTIDPSFAIITKPLSNKIGKSFCKGLKWKSKLFDKNGQNDSQKPVIFSKAFIIIELALRNSYRICLASFSESEILRLFSLSYNGNKFSAKLLKPQCQDNLLCKS